jgi:hypothetical protein
MFLPAERSDVGEQRVGQRFALAQARPRRQYRYSASKPLCYLFKGGMSSTKDAPPNRARTLDALPRHPIVSGERSSARNTDEAS